MRRNGFAAKTAYAAMLMALMQVWGCASTQEQSENYDNGYENSNGEATGNDAGGDGNNYSENISNPENTDLTQNNAGAYNYNEGDGEIVNSAPEDEFSNLLNNAQSQSGNIAMGEGMNAAMEDGGTLIAETTDQAPFSNTPPLTTGQSANEIPTDMAPVAPVANLPVPRAGGMVKYVLRQVNILAQPQGAVVGSFERGDHPVVWTEDGWSRLSDGSYLNSTALSTTPVGRQKTPSSWR